MPGFIPDIKTVIKAVINPYSAGIDFRRQIVIGETLGMNGEYLENFTNMSFVIVAK